MFRDNPNTCSGANPVGLGKGHEIQGVVVKTNHFGVDKGAHIDIFDAAMSTKRRDNTFCFKGEANNAY